tara:strand:- start:100 stop:489 length:390 start_codon:yes stop_codon:yes gene_type:complete
VAFGGENKIKHIMAERTYNGFTNRETWLVNVFYRESILENVQNGETLEGNLEYVKEAIQDRIDRHSALTSGIVQELICSKEIVEKINWVELEDHYTKELEYQAKTGLGLPINFDGMHLDHEEFMKENCK